MTRSSTRAIRQTGCADLADIFRYDVVAVAVDWDTDSVSLLKELLEETGSVIVLSSAWRESHPFEHLQALFKIHDLDKYLVDATQKGDKKQAIDLYIQEHAADISRYVILDDDYLSFRSHPYTVITQYELTRADVEKAKDFLSPNPGTLCPVESVPTSPHKAREAALQTSHENWDF